MKAGHLYLGAIIAAAILHIVASDGMSASLPKKSKVKEPQNVKPESLKPKLDSPTSKGKTPQEKSAGKVSAAGVSKQFLGGSVAIRSQFPWQVGISVDKSIYCGGSLINWNWVATSGYCTLFRKNLTLSFGAPNWNIFQPNSLSMDISANDVTVHPNYNPETMANDIALIRLPYSAPLQTTAPLSLIPRVNDLINSVLLPRRLDAIKDFIGRTGIFSGWGPVSVDDPSLSPFLTWANRTISNGIECANYYGTNIFTGSMLCVANNVTNFLQGLCQGDSGSPLVFQNADSTYTLQGIATFGPTEGCVANAPLVFTRVSNYLNWISRVTGILTL